MGQISAISAFALAPRVNRRGIDVFGMGVRSLAIPLYSMVAVVAFDAKSGSRCRRILEKLWSSLLRGLGLECLLGLVDTRSNSWRYAWGCFCDGSLHGSGAYICGTGLATLGLWLGIYLLASGLDRV